MTAVGQFVLSILLLNFRGHFFRLFSKKISLHRPYFSAHYIYRMDIRADFVLQSQEKFARCPLTRQVVTPLLFRFLLQKAYNKQFFIAESATLNQTDLSGVEPHVCSPRKLLNSFRQNKQHFILRALLNISRVHDFLMTELSRDLAIKE